MAKIVGYIAVSLDGSIGCSQLAMLLSVPWTPPLPTALIRLESALCLLPPGWSVSSESAHETDILFGRGKYPFAFAFDETDPATPFFRELWTVEAMVEATVEPPPRALWPACLSALDFELTVEPPARLLGLAYSSTALSVEQSLEAAVGSSPSVPTVPCRVLPAVSAV